MNVKKTYQYIYNNNEDELDRLTINSWRITKARMKLRVTKEQPFPSITLLLRQFRNTSYAQLMVQTHHTQPLQSTSAHKGKESLI
jgi:hypothetical protein